MGPNLVSMYSTSNRERVLGSGPVLLAADIIVEQHQRPRLQRNGWLISSTLTTSEHCTERTSQERILSLIRQVLKRLLFRLLDEQRRSNTRQHEKREYLQPAPTHATSTVCLAYKSNK